MNKDPRYLWYRLKYRFGERLPLVAPVDVSLELSSVCNMRCSYCYHADQDNLPFIKGIMSKETAFKIIKDAADCGVNSLKFNWKGEATTNQAFGAITAYAKRLASGSTFIDRITNSNFKFNTDKDEIFHGLCNQTKVKVSCDSFRKDVFEAQRTGGDHDITTRNIDKFYNHPMRGITDTVLVIQAVRTVANKDEDIEGEVKRRWPSALVSVRDMVAGRLEKDVSAMAVKDRDFDNRRPCKQAFVRLIFNWNGDAFPCCPDVGERLSLGNVADSTVKEIFHSARARDIREMLKSGSAFHFEPCRSCSSFESYSGYSANFDS